MLTASTTETNVLGHPVGQGKTLVIADVSAILKNRRAARLAPLRRSSRLSSRKDTSVKSSLQSVAVVADLVEPVMSPVVAGIMDVQEEDAETAALVEFLREISVTPAQRAALLSKPAQHIGHRRRNPHRACRKDVPDQTVVEPTPVVEPSPAEPAYKTIEEYRAAKAKEMVAYFEQYYDVKLLGGGTYGDAFRLEHKSTKKITVAKVVYGIDRLYRNKSNYMNEVSVMKKLKKYRHVTKYRCHRYINGHMVIYMDLIDGKDLHDHFVAGYTNLGRPELRVKKILFQVALALAALEKEGIVHHDIKYGTPLACFLFFY